MGGTAAIGVFAQADNLRRPPPVRYSPFPRAPQPAARPPGREHRDWGTDSITQNRIVAHKLRRDLPNPTNQGTVTHPLQPQHLPSHMNPLRPAQATRPVPAVRQTLTAGRLPFATRDSSLATRFKAIKWGVPKHDHLDHLRVFSSKTRVPMITFPRLAPQNDHLPHRPLALAVSSAPAHRMPPPCLSAFFYPFVASSLFPSNKFPDYSAPSQGCQTASAHRWQSGNLGLLDSASHVFIKQLAAPGGRRAPLRFSNPSPLCRAHGPSCRGAFLPPSSRRVSRSSRRAVASSQTPDRKAATKPSNASARVAELRMTTLYARARSRRKG